MTVHGKPRLDTTSPTSRRRAPAWLLVAVTINNQRDRAAKLLVPYHVASRQCARDADP